ncbi:hypothetical protein L9F63_023031, partial [Diploptera punctata]
LWICGGVTRCRYLSWIPSVFSLCRNAKHFSNYGRHMYLHRKITCLIQSTNKEQTFVIRKIFIWCRKP